ncbi:MAG: tetratricopeptide repeat protein [Spirochaetes bacterium]|nr:tetratricopeptide repeat protein [Spirochaetota bacterium]
MSLALVLSAVFISRWLVLTHARKKSVVQSEQITQDIVLEAWQRKDYDLILQKTEAVLLTDPMNAFNLAFYGFSAFYTGLQSIDGETRLSLMHTSVMALRKALIIGLPEFTSRIQYVIGKASFYRGQDFYDDAIRFLLAALDNNYRSFDIWEYLALAYKNLGETQKSIDAFTAAILENPDSLPLHMAAALVHQEAGNSTETTKLASRVWLESTDQFLREQAGLLLAAQSIEAGLYETGLSYIDAIKLVNPNSAEAWYWEGLAFQGLNDAIRARAAWRRAVSIDPMHAASRIKLNERQ